MKHDGGIVIIKHDKYNVYNCIIHRYASLSLSA
jgi:hypothetical protein